MVSKEYYIGMDVHKDFMQMAVFEEKGENPIYERKLNNDNGLLVKEAEWFARHRKTITAYEAGVPEAADEAARDLLRCREDENGDMRRVKQRLLKFLLRHGHIYTEGKNNWTLMHWRRMDKIQF